LSVGFALQKLTPAHHRSFFSCGEEPLDRYFQSQVTQDARRRIANCFIAVETATDRVAAFYTISAAGIATVDLPQDEVKRLPRYPSLPAIRIGRLAVDRAFQGKGLGAAMLADAAHRAMQMEAAVFTLLVDAKSDAAVAFYRRYGFRPLETAPRSLFLSLGTAAKIFGQER
jgi:ribosomal protein S18 acetylase RimI-like enzyme